VVLEPTQCQSVKPTRAQR